MPTVLGGLAEFERELICARTVEGRSLTQVVPICSDSQSELLLQETICCGYLSQGHALAEMCNSSTFPAQGRSLA